MLSIEAHATISLLLNGLFLALATASCFCDYFSFLVRLMQDYRVGLVTITHKLRFEDVEGDVYTSFPNFHSFACSSSHDTGILTICSNLLNFQIAGSFYLLLVLPLLLSILFCCLNLLMLRFARANQVARFWYPHIANAGVYVLAASGFLLISNVDQLEPPARQRLMVAHEAGISLLFLTAGVGICTLVHYCYLRKYRNLHTLELSAQAFVQKFLHFRETTAGREGENVLSSQRGTKVEAENKSRLSPIDELVDISGDRMVSGANPEAELREMGMDEDTQLELDRLKAEKAALESALSQAAGKIQRKREKLAQTRRQLQGSPGPDLDNVKALLEEKRRDLALQKQLYTQHVAQLESDLKAAETASIRTRSEDERKEKTISDLQTRIRSLETRLVAAGEDEDQLRNRLADLEKSYSEVETVNQKLEVETRRSAALEAQCSRLQSLLDGLGKSQTEQVQGVRKAVEEGYKQEIATLQAAAQEAQRAKEAEILRLREELRLVHAEASERASAGAESERYKRQFEEVAARLVHAQTEAADTRSESLILKRQLQAIQEEQELAEDRLKSMETAKTRLVEELEERHQADKERIRRFYEETQAKEIEDNKKFYEERLSNLTADLVAEREAREQLQGTIKGQQAVEGSRADIERLKEAYMKSFQEELDDLKRMYDSNAASLRLERDRLIDESASLNDRIQQLQRDRSRLLRDSESASTSLQAEAESKAKLQRDYEKVNREREELRGELVEMRAGLEGQRKGAGTEKQVRELRSEKEKLEREMERVREENEEFQQEIKLKEAEIQNLREEYMQVHKELFESRDQPRASASVRSDSRSSTHSIKESMVIEGMTSLHGQNPILEKIAQMKREAPMTYNNVWKLFESLLQEKVKLDRLEMSMGRQPRTMTEFMLDFMYLHYGLKTLALKQLKALVLSLQDLYRSNHIYGVLFCRFLGLFHPRPLPHHLAIYLLLVHEEFDRLAGRVKVRRPESFAENYDIVQYGGHASIIDVMELITRICKKDRAAGERIVAQLLPEQEQSRIEAVLLKVCGTMARMGRDPAYIFELLDKEHSGSIEYSDFVEGIRYGLNIYVSQDEAEDLCAFINDRGTGEITYEEWMEKVNFKEYSEKLNSRAAMVSKAALLSALVEEYEYEVVQDYYTLRHMIKSPSLDATAAAEILWQIDPSLEEALLGQFFGEAAEYESEDVEVVSPEALCIVVLRNRVGGFGVGIFGKRHIDVAALDLSRPKASTEGAVSELVVESRAGGLQVDILRRQSPI